MQTLQQNQGKKPLVRYLLRYMDCGSLDSSFGNQGFKNNRQTFGGVWTTGTRETTTLCLILDCTVQSLGRGACSNGACSNGRRDGCLSKISSGIPTPPHPTPRVRETSSGAVLRESQNTLGQSTCQPPGHGSRIAYPLLPQGSAAARRGRRIWRHSAFSCNGRLERWR